MIRALNIAGIALVSALAFALYSVKYETRATENHLAGVERQIAENEETLRVLKAEWSLLNQPDRLEHLAAKFLDLGPLSAPQIVAIEALPLPGPFGPFNSGTKLWQPADKPHPELVAAAGPSVRMPLSSSSDEVEVIWRR